MATKINSNLSTKVFGFAGLLLVTACNGSQRQSGSPPTPQTTARPTPPVTAPVNVSTPIPAPPTSTVAGLKACQEPAGGFNIVGGRPVTATDWAMASTVSLNYASGGMAFCSATIIGPNHVVTAAHCFYEIDSGRRLTAQDIQIGSGTYAQILRNLRVRAIVPHPRYNINSNSTGAQQDFDIGVLVFDGQLPANLRPICVGQAGTTTQSNEVLIAGYGKKHDYDESHGQLYQVNMPVGRFYPEYKEFDLQLGLRKGSCNGDSGGPAYFKSPTGAIQVIGAASRAPRFAQTGECNSGGGVYTDIRYYQDWMKCHFQNLGMPLTYLQGSTSVGSSCPG